MTFSNSTSDDATNLKVNTRFSYVKSLYSIHICVLCLLTVFVLIFFDDMTVINNRRPRRNWSIDRSNSSDAEALHISSEASSDVETSIEELNLVPHNRLSRRPVVRFATFNDTAQSRPKEGRRKRRRHSNFLELQTLKEENEDETQTVNLMDNTSKSPLTKLMEDPVSLAVWYTFTSLDEETQKYVMKDSKSVGSRIVKNAATVTSCNIKQDPLQKLSTKIKRAIKTRRNLSFDLIGELEGKVIDSFKLGYEESHIFAPKTCFERLLLHGIAQYHNLMSISVIEKANWFVHVFKNENSWAPMDIWFCQIVQMLRH